MSEFINTYNNIVRGLNEAAFGDIRNVFRNSEVDYLLGKPIGLVANSYDYMISHLRRNIGNTTHHYDGFSTPIGELANPFFNSFFAVPWFFMDGYKNSTANYLDYVRATYGATISVENINNHYDIRIIGEGSSVGVVQTSSLIDVINNGDVPINVSLINPNGTYYDTKLGLDNTYYAGKTLYNAISGNDERNRASINYGITNELKYYFGLNTQAVKEHNILDISSHNGGESYLSNGYYNLNIISPLEESNYGNYKDLGAYEDYYNSLGDDTRFHINENLFAKNKKYYPKVTYTDKNDKDKKSVAVSEKYTYFDEVGVDVGKDERTFDVKVKNKEGKYEVDVKNLQIRYIFNSLYDSEHSNITNVNGGVYVYTEKEGNLSTDIYYGPFNSGTRFGTYTSYSNLSANDLLKKTNLAFKKGNYDTIIARFHTDSSKINNEKNDTTQTAISKFGLSHGRNLLKSTPDDSQRYDNPYCRVWTFHHQYHRLADSIRPFQEKDANGGTKIISQSELYSKYGFNAFSAPGRDGFKNGRDRLGEFGVLNPHNGLVIISPTDSNKGKNVDIRNCMFSIENLAWKDSWSSADKEKNTFQNGGLSPEQKGPFGGRIMWFPPYGLTFNETVTVDWGTNNFIGRGESIFTYKNTTRSGQLNFKILIDHPSIVNYWENRGRSSSNSVDDVDDPEQQLLRFFAGCEMLSSKKAEIKKVDLVIKNEPTPSPNTEVYTFFVFFPNNYSGVDDDADFAMDYITNGVGTWSLENGNDYHPAYSEANVNGFVCGGYEMTPGMSISIITAQTTNNFICNVKYGNQNEENIYAQIGPSSEHNWDCKWYYRVDKSNITEKLKKQANYIDSGSNCLNSTFGKGIIIENLNVSDEGKLFSFADVFVALTDSSNNSSVVLDGMYDEESKNKVKEIFSKKNRISQIICTGQASIQGNSAKNSENETRNKNLAENRKNTVINWLKKYTGINNISGTIIPPDGENKQDSINDIINKIYRNVRVDIYVSTEETTTAQQNEMDAMNNRMEKHPTNPSYPINKGTGNYNIIDDSANIYYDPTSIQNKETYMKLSTFSKSVDYLTFNLKNSYENNTLNVNGVFNAVENFRDINLSTKDLSLNYPGNDIANLGLNSSEDIAQHDINNSSILSNTIVGGENETYATRNGETVELKRYDNESRFFELLELEAPFIHQKISDKIKYFDPAFHSISPEGFNARLTFLHQCTRQGPTCGASDVNNGNNTANNLAFGRPPVCILRLGDFYYTKIIIKSISIDYGDTMWDLNAEGIGVMPMIANVSMSFEYIGGSSLSGPIARLQNALSFNTYANTEVYDNRAELAEFDNNGNITKFSPYYPSK